MNTAESFLKPEPSEAEGNEASAKKFQRVPAWKVDAGRAQELRDAQAYLSGHASKSQLSSSSVALERAVAKAGFAAQLAFLLKNF